MHAAMNLKQNSTGEELPVALETMLVLGRAQFPHEHPQVSQVSRSDSTRRIPAILGGESQQ